MSGDDKAESASSAFRPIISAGCDETTREHQAIAASEIIDALQAGKAVEIRNAIIRGSLTLRSMAFESEITIERTRFSDPMDCSYATFRQPVSTKSSAFEKGVSFYMSTVEKDIFLEEATFKEKADFIGMRVVGNVEASGTTFEGTADFGSARIGGNAEFMEAVFKQKAGFYSAQIDGAAFFNAAIFEGTADFGSARIGGNAEFMEAVFKQKAGFENMCVVQSVLFDGAGFEDDVSLRNSRFRAAFFGWHDSQTLTSIFGERGKINVTGCSYDRIYPASLWEQLLARLDPSGRQSDAHPKNVVPMSGEDREATKIHRRRRRVHGDSSTGRALVETLGGRAAESIMVSDLQRLIEKYDKEIKRLEARVEKVKHRHDTLVEASHWLEEELLTHHRTQYEKLSVASDEKD